MSLSRALETTVYKSTSVAVIANGDNVINGEVLQTAITGATLIDVRYTSEDNPCRIGWFLGPSIDHCFPAEGTIRIGDNIVDEVLHEYQYVPFDDTRSDRTIQRFSTDIALHHVTGGTTAPLHPIMAIFNEYYGDLDYADRIVTAVLAGDDPEIMHSRDFDFSYFRSGDFDAASK